jgi:hypothetical protein
MDEILDSKTFALPTRPNVAAMMVEESDPRFTGLFATFSRACSAMLQDFRNTGRLQRFRTGWLEDADYPVGVNVVWMCDKCPPVHSCEGLPAAALNGPGCDEFDIVNGPSRDRMNNILCNVLSGNGVQRIFAGNQANCDECRLTLHTFLGKYDRDTQLVWLFLCDGGRGAQMFIVNVD